MFLVVCLFLFCDIITNASLIPQLFPFHSVPSHQYVIPPLVGAMLFSHVKWPEGWALINLLLYSLCFLTSKLSRVKCIIFAVIDWYIYTFFLFSFFKIIIVVVAAAKLHFRLWRGRSVWSSSWLRLMGRYPPSSFSGRR